VVPPLDPLGQALTTTVAAIRASRQGAPVYVYADRSVESLRELMPLARAGARGVVVRDADDDVVSLRRLVARGSFAHALETVTLAVREVVTTRHLPLVLLCLEHVREPLGASAFARRLRVSRRTLSAWALKAGAKGVRSLTSKCRVLAAIEMIRDSGRSIESVAHEMRFSSSAHLHNTVRRYTGLGPREAAARDAVQWCRHLFTNPVAGGVAPASRGKECAPAGMVDST
jgi:AraC-like DNA-binding protein